MSLLIFVYITFTVLLTLYYAIMVLFYLLGWQLTPKFKAAGYAPKTKITVVVPARDEQDNIKQLIDCVQQQKYPKELFELVVIDDHSTDLTLDIIQAHPMENLKVYELKNYIDEAKEVAFKKRAVEVAIKNTTSDLIVTTDADCTMGKKWLYEIAQFYEETGSKFIVAPVDYSPTNTVLDKLQNLDFLSMMGATGASVYYKLFNLSNGANMAYERETFLEVNPYKGKTPASGDDVFLIEKVGQKYPDQVNYLKNKNAIVYTKPVSDLKALFQQRMRWVSKTKHYKDFRTKTMAVLLLLFYFTLLTSFVLSFKHKLFLNIFVMQAIIKAMVDYALLEEVTDFFEKKKDLAYYPILSVVHFPFTFLVALASQLFKYEWKKREIKE